MNLAPSPRHPLARCRPLRRAAAWALIAVAAASPWRALQAGPWEGTTPQALVVRIVHDPSRNRDAYLLQRRYPDASLDLGFGEQGSTPFRLGPDNEGPATLRVDMFGRPWVAGASATSGLPTQAVVMRFLAHGAPDPAFGHNGRSATAPGGRSARALDLAPQPDGSAYVAGTVEAASGQETSGWWRLRPDGQVDTRFGLGGLWTDNGPGSSELLELASGPDGSVALALRRGDGISTRLEAWVLGPGATSPTLLGSASDAGATGLVWRGAAWHWRMAMREVPVAPAFTTQQSVRANTAPAGPSDTARAAPPRPDGASQPRTQEAAPRSAWLPWAAGLAVALIGFASFRYTRTRASRR